jgi:hypothetical protein
MGRNNLITIEDIYNLTNRGRDIWEKEVGNFSDSQNISSPFRKDIHPSFRIKLSENSGLYIGTDYGGTNWSGTAISFIKEKYSLTTSQAIDKIFKELNLKSKPIAKISNEPTNKVIKSAELLFEFNDKSFTDRHKKYFDNIHLDESWLNKEDVWAVDKWAINKKVQKMGEDEYAFAYVHRDVNGRETGKLKILRLGKSVDPKLKWRTNVPNSWMWRMHKINKDALILDFHFNICATAVQNESALIFLDNNFERFDKLPIKKVINFGTDFQGWHESLLITFYTGWEYFNTPNNVYNSFGIEDNADYISNFSIKSFAQLLKKKNFI